MRMPKNGACPLRDLVTLFPDLHVKAKLFGQIDHKQVHQVIIRLPRDLLRFPALRVLSSVKHINEAN
jgi:hypothetical protein